MQIFDASERAFFASHDKPTAKELITKEQSKLVQKYSSEALRRPNVKSTKMPLAEMPKRPIEEILAN